MERQLIMTQIMHKIISEVA